MRFRRLDLNLIIYLDALLTENSVSRAAERVNISQSAMSDALARLRSYFQDHLLVQVGREMVPTPLALSMKGSIRNVLLQVESVVSSALEFDAKTSTRRFRFLASDYVTDVLLAGLLLRLERVAPYITFDVRSFGGRFMEDFEQGDLDLLFTPKGYATDRHPTVTLFQESFVCVAWKGMRLGGELTTDQFESMGHICVSLGDTRTSTYDEWFMKHRGETRHVAVTVPSFRVAFEFLTGSSRLLTCHRRHALKFAHQYELEILRPPFTIPPIDLQMQWHRYTENDPGLAWIRNEVLQFAKSI
ncbi:hypothetical protein ADU59_00630 (plasmid) [Pararhizobium polonicum]|uniref:HTH lysR-type domain-containing protein n=1 Tax=Pararhizobium polonicum TaxID=1612624 RepID=A0A1C7P8F6_9HYPH|nr:LysR family transcriptional regulator [Pararhizobium polonicum]OBZ97553.1 hypothetical protein ADU59_00630 [Pararhizobium polonicum]